MYNSYNKEPSKCYTFLNCLALFLLTISIISGIIIYYYYGVNFVINFQEDKDVCTGIIWNYLVSSLILTLLLIFSFINTITSNKVLKTKIVSILFQGLVWFILSIWGIVITNDNNCQIKEKTIFLFAKVSSILQMVISIYIFGGGTISLCELS